MPSNLSYPGVYIEEVPSGVRTITGVATSITAFVGRALRGPVNDPVRVQSFAEYSRLFGGLWQPSTLSYAVLQFFQQCNICLQAFQLFISHNKLVIDFLDIGVDLFFGYICSCLSQLQ